MNRKNCQLLSLALCGCDRVCDTTGIEILLEFLEIIFLGGCKILLQLFWQDFEISIEFLDSLKIFKSFSRYTERILEVLVEFYIL